MRDYDRSSLANMFGGDATMLATLLASPTGAYRDAPAVKGSFPIIIYSLGQNDHNEENVVLAELLASHGYIVASVPQLGPSPRRFQLIVDDPASYDNQVRDLEFALEQTLERPSADGRRIAAMGMSMGGIYALLFAMRDARVGALVGLDASYMGKQPGFYFKYQDAYYFDPARMKAPLLSLYREDQEVDTGVVDKLRYSTRTLISIPKVIHADFTSYPVLTEHTPVAALDQYARDHRDQATGAQGHRQIASTVINFLGATFGHVTMTLLLPSRTLERFDAPTEEDFYNIVQSRSIAAAIQTFDAAKARHPDDPIVHEKTINRIGNEAIWLNRPKLAVAIMQLNVHAFPQSANALESLAEADEAAGDKTEALANYEKALAIDPANADAIAGRDKLRK
jgi:dienelactone hydrolase